MAIGTLSQSTPSNSNSVTTSASGKTLAQNFTQFLTLLTTQLKNQNPMEPLNTNEFTQQLVQFASVEQQLKSNQTLDSLLKATQTANTTTALGFVGMRVTADGVAAPLSAGRAEWTLNAPRGGSGTVTVKNSAGSVVFSATKQFNTGDQSFAWDGKTSDGSAAPEGVYSLSVEGKDLTGQAMTIGVKMTGVVDGVDFAQDGTVLKIGSISVPIANVKSLRKPL